MGWGGVTGSCFFFFFWGGGVGGIGTKEKNLQISDVQRLASLYGCIIYIMV